MSQSETYLDRPWLKSYKLGPYKLDHTLEPYPKVPLTHILDQAAEKYPTQTALLFLERTIKYHQLKTQTDRLASALAKLGLEHGDRVCLFLPNCLEFILADWAILRCGGVVVPTSILRTDEGLIYEAHNTNSKIVICQERNLERILGLKDQIGVECIIVTSDEGYDISPIENPLPVGVYEFRKLIDEGGSYPPEVKIDPDEDLSEISFTGGATGIPKGVMITHFNRMTSIMQGFPWVLKPLMRGFVGKASALLPIPIFHNYGHYIHLASAYVGLRVILIPDPRDIDLIVHSIVEYRPFIIPAVPTQYIRIADAKLSRMNALLMSGSAPLPAEVSEAINKKVGMPISEGYGLTETSTLTHYNVSAFSKITGFISKLKTGIGIPAPDTDCKLVDLTTGEEVPFGQEGEIVLRGPQIMKGYWPEPGSGLTPDGWLHTGDIGVMDEDGYFKVVDRTKDMVNVSGMKVYTTLVDEVLYRHSGVLMAATIGVPDMEVSGSERVMAVIQLKEEYRGQVTEEEIKAFCKEHLPSYSVPKYIEFREEMPLTVTEKVFKKALRDEILQRIKVKGQIT